MTQTQLHRAVAHSTGEDIDWISHRGFSLVENEDPIDENDWESLALDWDEVDAQRRGERNPVAE